MHGIIWSRYSDIRLYSYFLNSRCQQVHGGGCGSVCSLHVMVLHEGTAVISATIAEPVDRHLCLCISHCTVALGLSFGS